MTYQKERDLKTMAKLDIQVAELPPFCSRFFIGIAQRTTPLTRLGYAVDLKKFFTYLRTENEFFQELDITSIKPSDIETLTVHDIELYIASMHDNGAAAKQRKLCTLRSLFAYLFKVELIEKNIMPKVDLPRVKEKPITRLDKQEVSALLGTAELESNLRNETMLVLFLSTGIRVSELVGLNVSDIDIDKASFRVTRKGGVETILYLPEQCQEQLRTYLDETKLEGPLFTNTTGRRLSVRAVQKIVRAYASSAAPLKNISPHKLRSTFGTNLYHATGDIYVVADVLGHKDVNTTKKHYAAITEDIRKEAAKSVKL